MAVETATFRIWRGDAQRGSFEDYDTQVSEGMVVLDAVHQIQATQANDLAVRWNCKAGKCGSCSAEVNGRPRLMCMTRMSTFAEDEIVTVTPLRTFPVIRDLVCDVSFNYEKAREIPSFAPPKELQPGEYRMAQVDVERSGAVTGGVEGAAALGLDRLAGVEQRLRLELGGDPQGGVEEVRLVEDLADRLGQVGGGDGLDLDPLRGQQRDRRPQVLGRLAEVGAEAEVAAPPGHQARGGVKRRRRLLRLRRPSAPG